MKNGIIKQAIWGLVLGLFSAQAVIAEDAYLELKKDLQNGLRIEQTGGNDPVIKLASKTETRSLDKPAAIEWARRIIQSASVKKDVEVYDKSQTEILEAVSSVYWKCEKPNSLSMDIQAFYIRHLRSPNLELQEGAVSRLDSQKRLEKIPDDLYQEVLAFAKAHPTCGDADKGFSPYWNIMFKLSCCGKHKESIEWLNSIAKKYPDYEVSRIIALLRMGEKRYEKDLIAKYYEIPAGEEKHRWALALAYASTKETLKVLALELRNDEVDPGIGGGGFNQSVLSALRRSREWNVTLHRFFSFGQEDFDLAEAWCKKKFGTKYKRPKPPVRITQPII